MGARGCDHLCGQADQPVRRQLLLPHLQQSKAAGERALEPPQKLALADIRCIADAVDRRQGQRPEDRAVGGQHGRDFHRAGALPFEPLAFPAVRRARPLDYAEKTQPHCRVRVVVIAREPGIRLLDVDSQLLVQLASERRGRWLAGLDFPAGKLPVARIDLPRRPLAQQEAAVRPR